MSHNGMVPPASCTAAWLDGSKSAIKIALGTNGNERLRKSTGKMIGVREYETASLEGVGNSLAFAVLSNAPTAEKENSRFVGGFDSPSQVATRRQGQIAPPNHCGKWRRARGRGEKSPAITSHVDVKMVPAHNLALE